MEVTSGGIMAKASELSLEEMSRAVVEALEPKPTYKSNGGDRFLSPRGLWRWTQYPEKCWWEPLSLQEPTIRAHAEAILCQDPERKEAYGIYLFCEVTGDPSAWPHHLRDFPVLASDLGDVATASDEDRLRAMHAAVCGGG